VVVKNMNKHLGFSHGSPRSSWALLGALGTTAAALLAAPPANAQEDEKEDGDDVGLGLAPGSPQVGNLPGGVQPSVTCPAASNPLMVNAQRTSKTTASITTVS
jgi:hypothetical protein